VRRCCQDVKHSLFEFGGQESEPVLSRQRPQNLSTTPHQALFSTERGKATNAAQGGYLIQSQPPVPTARVFDFLLLSGSFDLMGEVLALEDCRIEDYPLNKNFCPMFYNMGITGRALAESRHQRLSARRRGRLPPEGRWCLGWCWD
jgi:hypothetical protein